MQQKIAGVFLTMGILFFSLCANTFYFFMPVNSFQIDPVAFIHKPMHDKAISIVKGQPVAPYRNPQNGECLARYAYFNFINGKIGAKTEAGSIYIGDIWLDSNGGNSHMPFALLDMNGDGTSELLLSLGTTYIFAYEEEQLSLWWSDQYFGGYSKILENRDILLIRPGAAPTHTTYHYLILDKNGREKEHIIFEKYDFDEDGVYDHFVYEHLDNLTEEEWLERTRPYLSVKPLVWKDYTDLAFVSTKYSNTFHDLSLNH